MSADAVIDGPATGGAALVIIDMVTDLDFPEGETMRAGVESAAEAIRRLRDEADARGVPTVYVNDNYGQWHSEREKLVDHAARKGSRGRGVLERIAPRADDFFVIKPQFSGFYATNLPVLLPRLGASRLILTGIAGDICVLFTAADAHMREYALWVPQDAVASADAQRTRWALDIMRCAMTAETRATTELALADWLSAG